MTKPSTLSVPAVSSYFSPTILGRGKGYVKKFAIFEAFVIGDNIKARCKGSYRNSYEVKATIQNGTIISSRCSCPVGDGGRCKHIAALLLTYIERPGDFKIVDEQETDLSRRSKEELVELIGKMLARHPDLERLAYMPRPKAGEVSTMEEYERQLEEYKSQAVSEVINCGDEYGASMELATALEQIEHVGDRLFDAKDVAGAAAVFEGVCKAITENYKDCIHDEEGEIADVVNECLENLASCFTRCKGQNDELRTRILKVLYDMHEWNIRSGGYGIGDDVPRLLIDHATEDEMKRVSDWAWTLLKDSDSSDWAKEHIAQFILLINGDNLDDATYLDLCELGKDSVAKVKRLLKIGRLNDAEKEARDAHAWHLVRMGDLFEAAGEEETIEKIMKVHLKRDADSRLADWLKKYYDRKRRPSDALAMAQAAFLAAPSIEGYGEVRRLSNQQRDWSERRPELLRELNGRGNSDLLARIHMQEGEWEDAISIAKKSQGCGRYSSLCEEIAEAIEKERPEQAIALFLQRAEELIGWRGRDNYRQAAAMYTHVSNIYDRLGKWGEWEKILDGILAKNDRLRALKQEIESAGLIRTVMR
ncbi:SWIM zinc finger family protein [Candidatus Peregrinibacteria bacterium]|nr:SWIM zinc finger family protein [Candidatus Peregrinibacteria bacterium]